MNYITAIRLWNEAIETTVGGDQEGNPYTQTSVFGGAIALEIGAVDYYHAKYNPDNLRKAAAFLREWADGLEAAIKEHEPSK